jgi:hypothetical protein
MWPEEISRRIRQGNSITFCANLGRSATETLEMNTQAFGMKSRAVHGKSKLTETKKGETVEELSQEVSRHFL